VRFLLLALGQAEGPGLILFRGGDFFKSSNKMSYADCFAAALAKLRKVELVTGDGDFRQVEGEVRLPRIR
jgi:predicted nucleic acid-binding protein